MKYSILFGGEAAINFTTVDAFKSMVPQCQGIRALQKSSEESTATYGLNDEALPENVRGDWNKIADFLTQPSA